MTFPLLKERDNKYKCSLHKLLYCRLFILFVLSRIKLVLHFVNVISVAERKNNNNVGQFVQKCKNSIFVVFIRLVKILICLTFSVNMEKCRREKKDCHLNVYVKYEQNRWLRHCKIESLFHETKQCNFPEKNVRVRLACHGFLRSKLTIFSIHTVLHPYSALSLMYRALGKTLPCRAHFTQTRF